MGRIGFVQWRRRCRRALEVRSEASPLPPIAVRGGGEAERGGPARRAMMKPLKPIRRFLRGKWTSWYCRGRQECNRVNRHPEEEKAGADGPHLCSPDLTSPQPRA